MELGVIILLAFAFVYIIISSKRQQRNSQETYDLLSQLKEGDKVKTHIGIYGVIKSIYSTTDGKIAVVNIGKETEMLVDINLRFLAGLDTKKVIEYDENGNEISIDGVPIEEALKQMENENAPLEAKEQETIVEPKVEELPENIKEEKTEEKLVEEKKD